MAKLSSSFFYISQGAFYGVYDMIWNVSDAEGGVDVAPNLDAAAKGEEGDVVQAMADAVATADVAVENKN